MNQLELTGMLLTEAKAALAQQGIQEVHVTVTTTPRQKDRTARDDSRVLLVYWEKSPVELLVCGK